MKVASFISNLDITNNGLYKLNIENADTISSVTTNLNGKFNTLQSYIQNNLPEQCTTLPDTLPVGKIVSYNNNLYAGLNNIERLAKYSEISKPNLKTTIKTYGDIDIIATSGDVTIPSFSDYATYTSAYIVISINFKGAQHGVNYLLFGKDLQYRYNNTTTLYVTMQRINIFDNESYMLTTICNYNLATTQIGLTSFNTTYPITMQDGGIASGTPQLSITESRWIKFS